jgi:hypothetical protein
VSASIFCDPHRLSFAFADGCACRLFRQVRGLGDSAIRSGWRRSDGVSGRSEDTVSSFRGSRCCYGMYGDREDRPSIFGKEFVAETS